MRKWITLVEQASLPFALDDALCAQVRDYIDEHLSDWSDDYADDEAIRSTLAPIIEQMAKSFDGGKMDVYRMELRPKEEIDQNSFGTLGHCWSWDADGAQVCHHDNAYDQYGEDNVHEVMFCAEVHLRDVDWIQSLAKNLVLRNEREISIREDAAVHVSELYGKASYKRVDFNITISQSGDF